MLELYFIVTLRQRGDFNFPIVNFPFLLSNIPSTPAYFFNHFYHNMI